MGLDVIQDGLLIDNREIGELGVARCFFEEATVKTSSEKILKIFDSGIMLSKETKGILALLSSGTRPP